MMEEECPCDFIAAPEDTMETTSLEKHAMMLLPTSEPIYTIGASEYFKVGTFHEIDHSKLSPNSPVQLKSVRIAMVSGKVENQVAVRYPSILSLRTHFSDSSFGKSEGKKIPALDEKYVMGLECAIQSLYKIVPAEEFTEKRNSWSFWASPSELESIQDHEIEKQIFFTDSAAAATNLVSKQGPCWSQLKFSGMVQWGQKRQVRFLGRHEEQKFESLLKETRASVELGEGANEKRKRVEEEEEEETEAEKAVPFGVMRMTRQCKRSHQNVSSSSGLQKSMIVKNDPKKQQLVVHSNKKRKVSIDRWSAERYKMAEENMLKVMKAKGAVYGNPIMRPDLRSEARKHIGDTGLLDHLLKHMAGKVAPGGAERFRRRHNAEGAMEYWLESADLADIRKEVGVQDPYWTPPPGWKFGDNLSQDHVTARELREIKEDLLKLKLDVRELAAKKGEEALAIVTTPSSCLSSFNWEDCGSLVSKQEVYAEFVKKKAKAEQQLKEISLTLSEMEEELSMLKPRVAEELITSESVMPPPLILGPTSMAEDNVGERIKEKKENEDHATESMDTVMQKGFTAEEKAAKIERLKSGFQICKPQGTFVWPIMGMSPQTVVNPDDYTVVLTPSSASSSTTSAPKPLNPFKPLAEKRPVSTATLTYVTGPFSPNISPSLGTPGSKITTTNIGNTSSINLNEAPLILE
ncbi:PREDICTED: protein DYAD [Lupinus angustifolius]|uniref:protein DYAD n=1 Tax=Lupinus angustifolius TaxID=3871 RepID=UPI00092F344D|nr:PREDICTED: protein DYAD [Lupinus angustifolius]